jgi:hypothetical protein
LQLIDTAAMKFVGIIFAVALPGVIVGSSLSLKHPLEDHESWDLHVSRQLIAVGEATIEGDINLRRLVETTDAPDDASPPKDEAYYENAANPETPYTIKHKKPKKHIPFAGGDTTHGMMIDAGSVSTFKNV